jgi:hypothetical protein
LGDLAVMSWRRVQASPDPDMLQGPPGPRPRRRHLLIIGFIANIAIVWTIGIIVLVVGIILAVLGTVGHAVGGRKHYF